MKRIVIVISLISVLIIFLFSIVLLVNRNNSDFTMSLTGFNEENENYTVYSLVKGDLENITAVQGVIQSTDNAIKNYSISTSRNSKIEILKSVGEMVKKGESIYSVNKKTMKSPVNGYVSSVVESENQLLISILNLEDFYITATLHEQYFMNIGKLKEINIVIDGETFKSEIFSVEPVMNDKHFTVSIKLNQKIPIEKFKPINSTVNVQMNWGLKTDIFYIPKQAIYQTANGYFVKVLEDGIVKDIPVEIGAVTDEFMEVSGSNLEQYTNVIKYLHDQIGAGNSNGN